MCTTRLETKVDFDKTEGDYRKKTEIVSKVVRGFCLYRTERVISGISDIDTFHGVKT